MLFLYYSDCFLFHQIHSVVPAISKDAKFQIRPRFQVESSKSIEEINKVIKDKLSDDNSPFSGNSTLGYVSLYPLEKDHHYWSPHLSVILEETETGSLIRGHYGPSPPVWTMFVFLYAVLGLGAVVITVIGFANRSLGLSSMVLWAVPVLIIAFLSLYYVSYVGQKKGHDQIEAIHKYFEGCLGLEIR